MSSTAINIKNFRTEIPGELVAGSTWIFPTVDSRNKRGAAMQWVIYVRLFADGEDGFLPILDEYFDSKPLPSNYRGWIKVDSGLVTGKIKESSATIISTGLNIGKKSATNVWTQALRKALSYYNGQCKKSSGAVIHQNGNISIPILPPMLAQNMTQRTVIIDEQHPVFVQRKYNGVRTVTTINPRDGGYEVIMYSRNKNIYPGFGYIKAEILPAIQLFWEAGRSLYFDGELYSHEMSLQKISGYSRRADKPSDVKLQYMIYDCFIENEPGLVFSDRQKIINSCFEDFEFQYCQKVETFEITSRPEIDKLYARFLQEKFEGAMVRLDTTYEYSHNQNHSPNLLKMKPVLDAEYEIVGWETGTAGKAANALMIICQTEGGIKFPVTPAAELSVRNALSHKMTEIEPNGKTHFENKWLGKKLIVNYDEKSEDDVPLRARTSLVIREWD